MNFNQKIKENKPCFKIAKGGRGLICLKICKFFNEKINFKFTSSISIPSHSINHFLWNFTFFLLIFILFLRFETLSMYIFVSDSFLSIGFSDQFQTIYIYIYIYITTTTTCITTSNQSTCRCSTSNHSFLDQFQTERHVKRDYGIVNRLESSSPVMSEFGWKIAKFQSEKNWKS